MARIAAARVPPLRPASLQLALNKRAGAPETLLVGRQCGEGP